MTSLRHLLGSCLVIAFLVLGAHDADSLESEFPTTLPILFSQLPARSFLVADGPAPLNCEGARIVMLTGGEKTRVLTKGFDGACDPDVSFDGLDYALFVGDQGERIKRMPAVTDDRQVVFIENGHPTRDGAGRLGSVSLSPSRNAGR